MAYFLLQKRPDGHTAWDDAEGTSYNFAARLPNARLLSKGDHVLFYRPLNCGTESDGCIYAVAEVAVVEISERGLVDAHLRNYRPLRSPVPLSEVGDPRRNPQHSFQPIPEEFFVCVMELAEAEGFTHIDPSEKG